MKIKQIILFFAVIFTAISFTSCTRVDPNHQGVLMQNYGKNGKSDYSLQKGQVWTAFSFGSKKLFEVPLWEQRGSFEDNESQTLGLLSADNTAFTAKPLYSYKAIEDRCVDLVFQNARLGNGDDFMEKLENNVLDVIIYDQTKEASRAFITDSLMIQGGNLKFEKHVESIIKSLFEEKGIELLGFSLNLQFGDKVKERIEEKQSVNSNIAVLQQQIEEQKMKNKLAQLQAEYNQIISAGLTDEILINHFISKWDGKTPLYGNTPLTLLMKQ